MAQQQAAASVSVACDDCGKRYGVQPVVLGKRVKCKACGNQFIAKASPRTTSPRPAAVAKPPVSTPAEVSPPAAKEPDDDLYMTANQQIAFALTPGGKVEKPASEIAALDTRRKWAIGCDVVYHLVSNMWMLLACLIYAFVLAVYAQSQRHLFDQSLAGLPIAGGAVLVVGTMAAFGSAVLAPEQFKAPWSAIFSLAIRTLIGGAIGIFVLRFRKNVNLNEAFSTFFHRVVRLIFQALGFAAMSGVMIGTAITLDTMPRREMTSVDLRAKQLHEDRAKVDGVPPELRPASAR